MGENHVSYMSQNLFSDFQYQVVSSYWSLYYAMNQSWSLDGIRVSGCLHALKNLVDPEECHHSLQFAGNPT